MDQSRDPNGHLIDYKEPEELEKIMDFSLPDQGVGAEGIFSRSFSDPRKCMHDSSMDVWSVSQELWIVPD